MSPCVFSIPFLFNFSTALSSWKQHLIKWQYSQRLSSRILYIHYFQTAKNVQLIIAACANLAFWSFKGFMKQSLENRAFYWWVNSCSPQTAQKIKQAVVISTLVIVWHRVKLLLPSHLNNEVKALSSTQLHSRTRSCSYWLCIEGRSP